MAVAKEPENINNDKADSTISKSDHDKELNRELLASAQGFAQFFSATVKRWEMIVYPAMIIVIFFMALGFFIIYSVVADFKKMATNAHIDVQLERVARAMDDLTENMRVISTQMKNMHTTMSSIDKKMDHLKHMETMSLQMTTINNSMRDMNSSLHQMRWDFSVMNRNVSKPMSMMNSFLPW